MGVKVLFSTEKKDSSDRKWFPQRETLLTVQGLVASVTWQDWGGFRRVCARTFILTLVLFPAKLRCGLGLSRTVVLAAAVVNLWPMSTNFASPFREVIQENNLV